MEAVVRDLARPDEIPQRVAELGCEAAARRGEQLRKERRPPCLQDLAKAIVDRAVRAGLGGGAKKREMLGEKERDSSVLRAKRSAAHPHDRARAEESVKVSWVVFLDTGREDVRLEIRRGHERAFELRDRVEERGLPTLAGIDAVPRHRESTERVLIHRLDLTAKARERSPAEGAEHTRIDPLRAFAPRAELSFHDRAGLGEPAQRLDDRRFSQTETSGRVARNERPVGARVAAQQRHERVRVISHEERGGETERQADTERVAIAARILGGDETPLAGDPDVEDAALADKLRDPVVHRRGFGASRADLVRGQIAETKEHLVDAVGVTRGPLANEVLQRELEIGDGILVEELAKLHLPEKGTEL